ncbi:hypothetical protein EJ08DRAFT_312633 [Tothia fuscella]|uniref:DUF7905 domain-containing protein n=1 Tax=Tothia fuscella TaxID=1048955 RepID=A0A9P4TXH2_9PEZI|nr:hypothetical protein EJ08DRAFT_312633 [Tothia fuscella]
MFGRQTTLHIFHDWTHFNNYIKISRRNNYYKQVSSHRFRATNLPGDSSCFFWIQHFRERHSPSLAPDYSSHFSRGFASKHVSQQRQHQHKHFTHTSNTRRLCLCTGISMPKRRAATRQLPKLGESDNDARKAWRGGNRPNKAFRLPRGFDPFQKAAGTQVLQAIASKSQAHIQAKHIQGVKNAIELQIWGDTSQCAAALQEIQVWLSGEGLSESGSSSAPKKFDRVQAYFEDRQPEILKQLRIEERRQLFRQQRPANATLFDHVYMVKWKPSGWALEDVLGQSLEGLDPIRMDCLCYIDFLNTTTNIAGGPCFVISGNKEKKVKRAAERLKNIDKHILARRFEHFQFFLVKPIGVQSPIDYSRYEIQLSSYNELKKVTLRNNTPVIEREAGKTMHLGTKLTSDSIFLNEEEEAIWSIEDLQPGSVCLGAKHAQHHMEQYLDHYLMSTLKYLPYYSGFVEMRATLGTCVFTSYKTAPDEAYDLRTFEEMLGDRNTQENEMEAHFTSKLGDEKVEFELRDRFFAASELFAFKDAPYFGAPAEKCDPIYKAVFHIEGNANTPDYRLEVDYRQSGQDEFNEAPVRWYRLDPGEDDLTKMVEITLIDLNNR